MKLKGIIDKDMRMGETCLTLLFPTCYWKCKKPCVNNKNYDVNTKLVDYSGEQLWQIYNTNFTTTAWCFAGLEPFESFIDLAELLYFIRVLKKCNDPIIIYTSYTKDEDWLIDNLLSRYSNIIVKWNQAQCFYKK